MHKRAAHGQPFLLVDSVRQRLDEALRKAYITNQSVINTML